MIRESFTGEKVIMEEIIFEASEARGVGVGAQALAQ